MTTKRRLIAMGDPQAPFEKVLEVLRARKCLAANDRLAPDVHLIAMGDYFDYGAREERADASAAAARTLGWLVGHAEEQVTLLLGNHDLARVGELHRMDDATWARAQAEADLGYYDKKPERPEEEFKAEFNLPSWEMACRDFCAFKERQRAVVVDALSAKRLRAAYAPAADLLLCHAGITLDTLASLGVAPGTDARVIAQRVNRALFEAFDAWRANPQAPFSIPAIHMPGSAHSEGTGIFYHRPTRTPEESPGRRFHPSRLPPGLTQVIGHIGDKKCRTLLGIDPEQAKPGMLRHLYAQGETIAYAAGVPEGDLPAGAARMIFIDGTMEAATPESYQLFDVTTRHAAE